LQAEVFKQAMHLPYLFEFSPLYFLQAALTIWMLVDAHRRGVEFFWFWVILFFQPFGAWVYFFVHKLKDFQAGSGQLSQLFHRKASLAELRYQVEQTPTAAARLELGQRLVESGDFSEALPHLEAVLQRESEHCQCLFLVAQCHRGLGRPSEAVPPLEKLIAKHASWSDYQGWRALVDACLEAGDSGEALTRSRELARLSPSLQHKCMLAERLLELGDKGEARKVVEQGLDDYRFTAGPGRRRDRRWVGRARQLLKDL
jgi:hypothetical protein